LHDFLFNVLPWIHLVQAVSRVRTGADQALWAGMLNFWCIGRIRERGRH